MKRVLIPGVILCGADVAQAVDDKNMYMHVFEEMTVYAPVPVPVNGNTHYTSESIERLPTGNGNISDLLRTNPAVRMDSTQSTSLNQGDIRPEKISIHGASPYQNAYLIDGISATNNLNPANESDASSATNISGMSQGYYLDVSLLDNVTLYDSFVPVEFGRFNGGVIDAKIKRFNADDSKVKLGYRTTRSDWLHRISMRITRAHLIKALQEVLITPQILKRTFIPCRLIRNSLITSALPPVYRAASLISPARIMFRMTALSPVGHSIKTLSILH